MALEIRPKETLWPRAGRGTRFEARQAGRRALTDRSHTLAVTMAGAAVGALTGYLFFTEPGRSARRRLEPALEDFARELLTFRRTVETTLGVVTEGWRSLSEALTAAEQSAPVYRHDRQTAPF
jgi:hypothetical protein